MQPYRPFPSPATPSSTSPNKHPSQHHYGFPPSSGGITPAPGPSRRASTNTTHTTHSRGEADYSDSESTGEEDKTERDKLELRREKNRVKQRNLRQRRANHIADLERSIANLRAEHAAIQQTCALLQQRETHLQGWVHDLESALFRNGLAADVDSLRRVWDRDVKRTRIGSMQPLQPMQPMQQMQTMHLPTPTSTAGAIDPLSTLARAASSMPGPSSMDGRSRHPSPRPSLSRPGSFSKPYENPYPTPEIAWGSQMNEWMHVPDAERKRKRDSLAADYPSFDSRPSSRPGLTPMSGRLSESNLHILPPIQSYHQSHQSQLSPAIRPLSAPHSQYPNLPSTSPSSASTNPANNVSPKSLRISVSDLVSPRIPPLDPHSTAGSAFGSGSTTSGYPSDIAISREREVWPADRGDLSVIRTFSALGADPPTEISNEQRRKQAAPDASVPSENERRERVAAISAGGNGEGRLTKIAAPTCSTKPSNTSGAGASDSRQGGSQQHNHLGPFVEGLTRPSIHPSVHTARILLLSLLPHPLSLETPPALPSLSKQQQTILLTALSNLSPPHIAETFRTWQHRRLPADDAKILLEYQSSMHSDLRLIHFPISILRARVIAAIRAFPDAFDLTAFISSTLASARIFGDPLDTDAWELPDEYWDVWGQWFPRGREYCHSLSEWRRRDGHVGSSVVEMLLGLEGEEKETRRRREDPVGKPPKWTF